MEEEIWKAVKGYEGYYEVSNLGKVRSLDRIITDKRGFKKPLKGRMLKLKFNRDGGYLIVILFKGGKKDKTIYVHQLVAQAFLGHEIGGHKNVVNHINGINTDNNVSNLEITTQRENATFKRASDKRNLSSEYVGVCWDKYKGKWIAVITINGKQIGLGSFHNEKEASIAYNKALLEVEGGSFNRDSYRAVYSSTYKGVCFKKKTCKWESRIYLNRRYYHLGTFPTELLAHNAYLLAKEQIANGTFLQLREQDNKNK